MRLSNIEEYVRDPQVRIDAWQERLRHPAWTAEPNDGHRALADLERRGTLLALMTQNIDGLHQAAGSERVLELHGTIREAMCLWCGRRTPMQAQLDRVRAGEPDPPCVECGGIQKSATVSFGQQLDPEVVEQAFAAAEGCDLFLAIGTSLAVTPASYLAVEASRAGARLVIINQGETPLDDRADAVLRTRSARSCRRSSAETGRTTSRGKTVYLSGAPVYGPVHGDVGLPRILAAVLFTDIVDSTAVAEELGDRRWKTLVDRHHRLVRQGLKRYGGRELDTAGDGFFASFKEPASAIGCASALVEAVRELGIEIRTGVHFGECEQIGRKLGGITVVVGARIMALGGAGDVLVSGTAAELARGAGFGTVDRGTHVLKGVEGEWRVVAVEAVDRIPLPAPLDPAIAAERRSQIAADARPGRSRLPIAIAAVVAVVVLGAAAFLAFRGGDDPMIPGPDTVARIDPADGTFDQVVSVGADAFPDGLAANDGKVWVGNVAGRTVVQIDVASGESQTFGTPSVPTGVAAADGRIWVTYGFQADPQRRLDVVDPGDPVLQPAGIDVPDGSYPITAGAGALWIADPLGSTVMRFDPGHRRDRDRGPPDRCRTDRPRDPRGRALPLDRRGAGRVGVPARRARPGGSPRTVRHRGGRTGGAVSGARWLGVDRGTRGRRRGRAVAERDHPRGRRAGRPVRRAERDRRRRGRGVGVVFVVLERRPRRPSRRIDRGQPRRRR